LREIKKQRLDLDVKAVFDDKSYYQKSKLLSFSKKVLAGGKGMKTYQVVVLSIIVGLIVLAVVLPVLPELFMGLGVKSEIIKPLSVDVQDVAITGIGFNGLHGKLVLSVRNPNPFPAQFDSIDFNIYTADGTLVAQGTVPYTQTIPPNSNRIVSLNFEIPWTGGGKLILEKIKGFFTGQKTKLRVDGTIYIDLKATKIPISFSKWTTA
jgi:LEA14-like dessication related protein